MIKTALKNTIIFALKNYYRNKKKMSFLKIRDPTKRDQTVKEYLELKKNIRGNLLSERTGEQQLQTELTKFYRPITETQKATREITEGLKPIREGIENLPQAITFPPTQPIGEATGEKPKKEKEPEEKTPENLSDIAYNYLHGEVPYPRGKTFGIYEGTDGQYHMGRQSNKENKKILTIAYNNIIVVNEKSRGTPGLWELIMEDKPRNYTKEDMDEYKDLLKKTNALHRDFNPYNPNPRSSSGYKWNTILSPIWDDMKGFGGKGVVIMSSDPNALLERLDLLLASQEAGHTGVGNELVSICDELKRQGVLDAKTYKKLNSIIKNDST